MMKMDQNGASATSTKILVVTAALAVIGLAADLGIQNYLAKQHHQDQITAVNQKMAPFRARVEESLFANLLLINGMAAYISINPGLTADEFTAMAKQLMAQPNLLRNIAAAPDFVLTYVYPLEGNEAILGQSYRDLPGQWDQARRARDTGRMIVAGPLKLIQGGYGLVGRAPVFSDRRGERHFWGLVSAVIDLDRLIDRAGAALLEDDLDFSLRGRDGLGAMGEAFHGPVEFFSPGVEMVKMNIKVPSGAWLIAGRPRGGWDVRHPQAWLVHLAAALFVVLGCLIAYIRIKNEIKLRQARQSLAEAQTVARLGSWEFDIPSDRSAWSDEVYRLFEVDPDTFDPTRENFFKLVHPEDRPGLRARLERALQQGKPYEVNYRLALPDGREKHIHGLGRVFHDKAGRPVRMLGTIQDVTEIRAAETALRESQEMLRKMSEASHDAIVMIKADDAITFWNRAAEKMFGYTAEEVMGRRLHRLIAAREEDRRQAEIGMERFARTGDGPVLNTVQEFMAVRRDGGEFPVERSVAAFRMGGQWYAVGGLRDITERKETQAKLEELATTDGLTGLFNRRYFTELANGQIAQAGRYAQPLSLIMFDVDHFKSVNDRYGHDVGDMVLQELARMLHEELRQVDIAGRLGGEEFGVCLPETDLDGAVELAERLRRKIAAQKIEFSKGSLTVTVSLGAAQMASGGEALDKILKRADEALYQAKEAGRNRVVAPEAGTG